MFLMFSESTVLELNNVPLSLSLFSDKRIKYLPNIAIPGATCRILTSFNLMYPLVSYFS